MSRLTPAVLLLLLWGCKDHMDDDFMTAWAQYHPVHVADNAH